MRDRLPSSVKISLFVYASERKKKNVILELMQDPFLFYIKNITLLKKRTPLKFE